MNKKFTFKIGVYFLWFFSFLSLGYSVTQLNSCQNITTAGSYALNQSVATTLTCFDIQTDNVTFDCQGYNLTGNQAVGYYGFNLNIRKNVTINNCIISNFSSGISLSSSNNNTLNNITVFNSGTGIGLGSSSNNILINNNVTGNSYGIYLSSSSSNNILSNITANNNNNNNGIGLYTNCNSNLLNNITANNNNYKGNGIEVYSSNNNTINNIIVKKASTGLQLYGNNNILNNASLISNNNGVDFSGYNNSIDNVTSTANGDYGISIIGTNSSISNSLVYNNSAFDIYIPSSALGCPAYFSNVKDNLGKYHIYSNNSVNIDGWTNISSLILCDANNSIIKNLNVDNINKKGTFLQLFQTGYTNITNVNISNYYNGIYLTNSNNNNLNKTEISSIQQYGIYSYSSNNNSIKNINNSSTYYLLMYSSNNILDNITNINSIWVQSSSNNNILSNIITNNGGISLSSSSNNVLSNITSNNFNGIALGSSNYNILNNITAINNSNYGVKLTGSSNNNLSNMSLGGSFYAGIYLNSNSNNNVLNNLVSKSNTNDGVQLKGSSNNSLINIVSNNNRYGIDFETNSNDNHFDNITAMSNSYYGVYLADSFGSNFSNSLVYNNTVSDIGVLASSVSYCSNSFSNVKDNLGKYHFYFNNSVNIDGWTNISSLILCGANNSIIKNMQSNHLNKKGTFLEIAQTGYANITNLNLSNYYNGIGLYMSNYNILNNIVSNNNSYYGITLSSSNYNILNNIVSNNNSYYGISFGNSNNNNISNSDLTSNVKYNINFYNSLNNLFYNNSLDNSSMIYSNDWATYPDIFNTTIAGIGGIGNYWNNINCIQSEARLPYLVCINPSQYDINLTNVIIDYAPLVIPPPDYVPPTPANNSHYGAYYFTIKINDPTQKNTGFYVTINDQNFNLTNNLDGTWQYVYYPKVVKATNYTFRVYYLTGQLGLRTFTFYPDLSSKSFSGYGLFSGIISIFLLLLWGTFRKW